MIKLDTKKRQLAIAYELAKGNMSNSLANLLLDCILKEEFDTLREFLATLSEDEKQRIANNAVDFPKRVGWIQDPRNRPRDLDIFDEPPTYIKR